MPAKKTKSNKITKKMNFAEIIEKNPDAGEILFKNGMHCIGCGMSMYETLEQGAIMHGVDPDKIVNEINKKSQDESKPVIKKKKAGKK